MKQIIIVILTSLLCKVAFSQENKINPFSGVWRFVPPEKGYDSSWVIFRNNKSIDLTFWLDSKRASVYGTPYTYYGFWDSFLKEPQPKHISELKPTGKYIFFYDNLITDETKKNKIGYDSLGNLYQPTRMCQWTINDELPKGLPPTTLTLHFNMKPDVYKKVDKIPDYVLLSLRNNKEDWQWYLDFVKHKEFKIKASKSFIYSIPDSNKQTKIYLIKGDDVEVLEEKNDWLHIRYYGKKAIEGWIKNTEVE